METLVISQSKWRRRRRRRRRGGGGRGGGGGGRGGRGGRGGGGRGGGGGPYQSLEGTHSIKVGGADRGTTLGAAPCPPASLLPWPSSLAVTDSTPHTRCKYELKSVPGNRFCAVDRARKADGVWTETGTAYRVRGLLADQGRGRSMNRAYPCSGSL